MKCFLQPSVTRAKYFKISPLECQQNIKISSGNISISNLLFQETQVWPLDQKDPLEKGMATHSSILAGIITWTEEAGWLQSMGFQRVGHCWVTNTFMPSAKLSAMNNADKRTNFDFWNMTNWIIWTKHLTYNAINKNVP